MVKDSNAVCTKSPQAMKFPAETTIQSSIKEDPDGIL
jgi:hypothetical protein